MICGQALASQGGEGNGLELGVSQSGEIDGGPETDAACREARDAPCLDCRETVSTRKAR